MSEKPWRYTTTGAEAPSRRVDGTHHHTFDPSLALPASNRVAPALT